LRDRPRVPPGMDLSPAVVDDAVAEYPGVQPLDAVERDHLEILPAAFADGDYGWRTAEWVVQWYYRRFLGGYPDADRRAGEASFDDNGYEAVHDAVDAALAAEGTAAKLHALAALDGVDVPVAAAFLAFAHPDRYVPVGEREWSALQEGDELDAGYPDPPGAADYERYLGACRTVAERCDRALWDVYRALWVLGAE